MTCVFHLPPTVLAEFKVFIAQIRLKVAPLPGPAFSPVRLLTLAFLWLVLWGPGGLLSLSKTP